MATLDENINTIAEDPVGAHIREAMAESIENLADLVQMPTTGVVTLISDDDYILNVTPVP